MRFRGLRVGRRALTCRQVVELVTDYFENALTSAERRRFDGHIAACAGCSAYLDQLRAVHESVGRLRPADLSAQTERELRRAFAAWRAD